MKSTFFNVGLTFRKITIFSDLNRRAVALARNWQFQWCAGGVEKILRMRLSFQCWNRLVDVFKMTQQKFEEKTASETSAVQLVQRLVSPHCTPYNHLEKR
jgi:hypothetical protein